MRIYTTVIFCFLSALFSIKAADKDIYFYHLTTRDGLSQMSILSIYQDEFSAMWFGTTEGLDRYNGSSIESFKPSDNKGIKNNSVQSITGNKSGAIYAIVGSDLVCFDLNTMKFDLLKPKVKSIKYVDNELWIAKDDSIFKYNEFDKTFELYTDLKDKTIVITSILPIKSGNVWLGTTKGLIKINSSRAGDFSYKMKDEDISYLYLDSKSTLWIGTKINGVYSRNDDGLLNHYIYQSGLNTISDNQIRNIKEDQLGNIWVATFYGLNKFDPSKQQWQQFVHDDSRPYSISHSSVYPLYIDEQGSMWAGTYFGGVNYFNIETDVFNFYGADFLNKNSLSFPYVGSMIEDSSGNLWICTEGGDLNCLNLKSRTINRYRLHNDLSTVERYNQKCILYNKSKNVLYIGLHNGGLAIFDINQKKTKILNSYSPSGSSSKITNYTVNHAQFYKDKVLLMTSLGLLSLDPDTESLEPFNPDTNLEEELKKAKRLTFHIDQKERLWIVTDGLTCIDLKTNKISEYKYDESDKHAIGKCEVNYIFESKAGDLFFSTMGSGIFKYNESQRNFDNFTSVTDGLMSDFCYSISESPSGNLILLHNKGLSFIDPKNPQNNVYRSSRNFPIIGFNTGNGVYITSENEIFIGGSNGLMSFFENTLNKVNKDYNIYFDKLYLGNTVVAPEDGTNILSKALPLCHEITLKYDQNNFKIEFATNSYIQTITHDYEYRLLGLEDEWNETDARLLSYTNLSPGRYVLEVRDIGSLGEHNQLVIIIEPPFYQTSLAYIIYVLITVLLIYAIVRFYRWRTKLQESLKFEHKEKERIKELNQMKLRFFTNVSHEFRTPLTLIVSYVDSLLVQKDLPQAIRSKIDKISKNTNHLLDLITELLDFRKQEQGFYKPKVKRVELVNYIRRIYDVFKDYAKSKDIEFTVTTSIDQVFVYIDAEYFRKAIYNLLSNAFKYTSAGGKISISIKLLGADNVLVEIKDTGIGIASEFLDRVFERFYQIEYRSSETTVTTGTGIGLALTREIINNHGGEISVSSALNEGSTFTIKMKLGYVHFSEDMISHEDDTPPMLEPKVDEVINTNEEQAEVSEIIDESKDKPTLLLVDDNVSILDVLTDIFGQYYHIVSAYNGKEALEVLKKEEIDLIISDVLMPEMSGKEFCYKAKNNILTSHIPIVLLTAQTSEDQVADGYMFGADAYVTKPFNARVLLSICNNLIKNRIRIYEKFRDSVIPNVISQDPVLDEDQLLINKAVSIVKQNLSNPDFDMNKLAAELGYGRSKLYVKIKEKTGMTPNEFTLNVKLKEAVFQLENSSHKNISEIAIEFGFSSTKYFTKCFKNIYGITPQDWRKKKNSVN